MGLEHAEFAMMMEEDFGITISSARIEQVSTVGQAHRMVCELLAESGRTVNEEEIVRRVNQRIAELSNVDASSLSANMRLVEDLDW